MELTKTNWVFTELNDMTQAELEQLRDEQKNHLYSNSASSQGQTRFWNETHDRISELHRVHLAEHYNISSDDFGHYTTLSRDDAQQLIYTSYIQICTHQLENMTYWRDKHTTGGDDDTDYQHSILDQLTALHTLMDDDDANFWTDTEDSTLDAAASILKLLNLPRDETDNYSNAYGFIYGYADHGTDISDLMLANHEEF